MNKIYVKSNSIPLDTKFSTLHVQKCTRVQQERLLLEMGYIEVTDTVIVEWLTSIIGGNND
jgi:hypothetical protein